MTRPEIAAALCYVAAMAFALALLGFGAWWRERRRRIAAEQRAAAADKRFRDAIGLIAAATDDAKRLARTALKVALQLERPRT